MDVCVAVALSATLSGRRGVGLRRSSQEKGVGRQERDMSQKQRKRESPGRRALQ